MTWYMPTQPNDGRGRSEELWTAWLPGQQVRKSSELWKVGEAGGGGGCDS